VVKALGRHVQYNMMYSVAGVRASAQARPPTKELFLIIAHDDQGDNPGHKKGLDDVLYKR